MSARSTAARLALPLLVATPFVVRATTQDTRFEPSGFTLAKSVVVPLAPAPAFEAFTGDVSPWWDHHMSEQPFALEIEPRVGGAFVERFDDSGAGVEHARVTFVQPGARLVLRGPLGFHGRALDLVHSFQFRAVDGGTEVALELHGAGELTDDDVAAMDRVWDHFLGNYRTHAEGIAAGD